MNYEKLSREQLYDMSTDDILNKCLKQQKELNEDEKDVFEVIGDKIDDCPIELFQKSSEELNQHFGGHDNVKVTDKVKEALYWFKASLAMINAEADMLEEIANDTEEE